MKYLLIGSAAVAMFLATFAVVFYLEREAEFVRIDNAKPTCTKFDPVSGKIVNCDYHGNIIP